MANYGIGKIFRTGRSQAVRLPKKFRLTGDRVRIRFMGRGIFIEPEIQDCEAFFAEFDRLNALEPDNDFFMKCNQPVAEPEDFFK